jgi:DNA-directed RNA polymerase specialized sigma24 family protein
VDSIALQRRHGTLTREAFDKLISSLDANREIAAEKYERIRGRLVNFYEYRGCSSPEDYADITINCAAKKLNEGSQIYSTDPLSFFIGIARNLMQEYWELVPKRASSLQDLSEAEHPSENLTESLQREEELNRSESELGCLEHCLEEITPQNRDLIIGYYVGEKSQKIDNRKRLATQFDIAPATLRLRAFRLREKLESCVKGCVQQSAMKQNPMFSN